MNKFDPIRSVTALITSLLLTVFVASAQTPATDSLLTALRRETSDTARVMIYNKISRGIANTTHLESVSDRKNLYTQAIQYADSGLLLAQSIGFRKGEAELLRTIGAGYYFLSDYDLAIHFYEKALEITSELKDEYGKAALMYNIAMIYQYQGKTMQALKYNFIAMSGWEKLGLKLQQQLTTSSISQIYEDIGEYRLALEYASKSVDIATEMNDTLRLAALYSMIAGDYLAEKDTASSIASFEKSIEFFRAKKRARAEAQTLFNYVINITSISTEKRREILIQVQKYFEKNDPEHHNLAHVYWELANIKDKTNERDSAEYYRNKALRQAMLAEQATTISSIYNKAGAFVMSENRLDQAEKYYHIALDANNRVGSAIMGQKIYAGLAEVYRQKGEIKRAFEIMQRSIHIRDSITADESKKRMEVLQMQYELNEHVEQQEKEWKAQADRQQQTLERRRRIIIFFTVVIVLLAGLLGKLALNRRRTKHNNVLLHERHEEILQIQEELRQSTDELNMYKEYLEEMVRKQTVEQADKDWQLRTMSDNLPGGFIYRKVTEPNGNEYFSYISGTVEQLIGISAEKIKINATNLFSLSDDKAFIRGVKKKEKESIRKMSAFTFEFRYAKNGAPGWLYNHSLPHADENGNIVWDSFVIDITKQKEVEASLEKAKEKAEESDRLKSVFLSNMSHEIRTPMNAILGFIGFVEKEDLPGKKRSEYVRIIQDSVKQLLRLIENIIDISKLEVRQIMIYPTKFELNALMREIESDRSKTIDDQKPLDLVLDTGRFLDNDTVFTDRVRLKQILSNLIDNALKYTDKGFIRFGYEPADNPSELLIFVEDTGIGIPPDQLEVIFEYFRQGANTELKGGTGLGLSISKGLVEHLGGRIRVESIEGRGSTFSFTIKKELKGC